METIIEFLYTIIFWLVFLPLGLLDRLGLPVVLYSGGWINGPNKFGLFMVGIFYIIVIYLIIKLIKIIRRPKI